MSSLTNDDRQELRATARTLLEHRAAERPPDTSDGLDRDLWNQIVDLGWTTIHVDERFGGAGCDYADLAVVLHELGRTLSASPFLASAVLANGAHALADDEALATEYATELAAGTRLGSVALAGVDGSYDPTQTTVRWRTVDGSPHLDGAAGYVLDADAADHLVVVANDDDGIAAVVVVDTDVSGVRIEPTPMVDATRRLFRVTFDDLAVASDRMLCEPGSRARELVDRVVAIGAVATACDAVGNAEQALELTTQYAKEREQFGRPIGTFQAVKHHCSNMSIAVETGRAAARSAVAALDGDPSGWSVAASIVSSYVGPACSEACALALRVHGGIGFTWEHDCHRHLKRAKLDEVLFGTPTWHRHRLADTVFPTIVGAAR